MATYKVTDPTTGKTVKLIGDSPPTETELNDIFSKIGGSPQPQEKTTGEKFTSIVKAFVPAATNIATDVGKTISSRMELSTDKKLRGGEDAYAQKLLSKAQNEIDPIKKAKFLDIYRSYTQDISGQRTNRISTPEFSEDVDRSVGERALAASGEITSLLIPQGSAATRGGRLVQAGVQGSKVGALRGLTAIADSPEERVKNTIVDTITGGVTGAATQGVFEGLAVTKQGIYGLTKKASDKALDVYAGTFKESKGALKRIYQQGGEKELARKAIDMDLPKSRAGVTRELIRYKPEFEKQLDTVLTKNKNTVDIDGILDSVDDQIKKVLDTPQTRGEYKQAVDYLTDARKTYGGKSTPKAANQLRRDLDKITGDMLFMDTQGKKKAIKLFAGGLRGAVKEAVPESRLLFDRYAVLSTLQEVMTKDPKISLPEIMGGLIFSGGGIVPTMGGVFGAKVIRNPSTKRSIASMISNVPQLSGSINPIKSDKIIPFLSAFTGNR